MDDGAVHNEIKGGFFLGAVIQGQYVTLHMPPQVRPTNKGLPPASPTFVGRRETARELHERLAPGDGDAGVTGNGDAGGTGSGDAGGITVLTGLGGVGKTELALQTARRALAEPDWFPGGVLYLDLSGYDDERRLSPEQALDSLLRYLAVPAEHIPPGRADRSALLRTVLDGYAEHGRRVLVFLDNADGPEQVHPLLPSDGATHVLVTSRHTLTFHLGERVYDLDCLDRDTGVEFIRRVVERSRPGDGRVAAEPAEAARIAELCAGLPLALWIATALLTEAPTRSLANLREALEDSQRRLDRLSRRTDKAVRAAFELSYRALSPEQTRLFLFLSLNPGPDVSTEAAARLLDEDPYDVQDLLDDLARAHLIGHGATYGRWNQHDLVRLFAHEKGNARARQDRALEAAGRLFDHYRQTTEAADTALDTEAENGENPGRFADLAAALEWLDAERANLVETVKVAHGKGRPDVSVALSYALARYLRRRRHLDDWIDVGMVAVAVHQEHGSGTGTASALNHYGAALAEVRRFEEARAAHQAAANLCMAADHPAGLAESALNLAGVWFEMGDPDMAARLYEAAAGLYERLGDDRGRRVALTNRATVLASVREFDRAMDDVIEAEALTAGETRTPAALVARGRVLAGKRRFAEAVELFREAAEIQRRRENPHGEAAALTDLGRLLIETWQLDEATEVQSRAAELYHSLGDRHGEAIARNSLGLCLQRTHRLPEAAAADEAAVEAFIDTRDRQGEGLARVNLGTVLTVLSRHDEAVEQLTRAVACLRACDDRHGEAIAQNHLGCALRRTAEFDRALEAHDRAVLLFRETRDRKSEADVLNNIGTCRRVMGQFDRAVRTHAAAAEVYREVGERHGEAEAEEKSAEALIEAGRNAEAAEAGARAVAIFETTEDRYGTAVAYTNLGVARVNLGHRAEAVAAFQRAIVLFRELDCEEQAHGAYINLTIALDLDETAERTGPKPPPPKPRVRPSW
ncbi:tetratricopeptide repeat protein, partial [Streptomyces sp. FH025]|uniref:tetratricopeptide repeat protein n=1 Tax=Streptomyces sp. FH025 TaxID=2815937 RepID=UPI001A9F333B